MGSTSPSNASVHGMVEAERRSYEGLFQLVASGQDDGSVRSDVDPMARVCCSMASGGEWPPSASLPGHRGRDVDDAHPERSSNAQQVFLRTPPALGETLDGLWKPGTDDPWVEESRSGVGSRSHVCPNSKGNFMFDIVSVSSAYVSQVFPLGPADAIEATEAWYRHLSFAPGGRRLVGGRRLRLRPCFEPTDFDPLLLRRLCGTLWVRWWPVRIELELARYSRFTSEIALRPTTLGSPVAIERYCKDAARAVEEVVAAITTGASTVLDRSPQQREDSTNFAGGVLKPNPGGFAEYLSQG